MNESGPHHGHYVAIVRSRDSWVVFDDDTVDTVAAFRARKRRVLPERTEAGAENEFAATGAFS